ncbi:vanadium-dependent haloperoxidase [Tenacibaculum tangerinum]|uniref:Vanadium-dependent haloperoxidase n=1 Tax=Tenacibaculum tangerinum TaxID=3038772 RepID=A0ABY8L3T7_9FLAO|nr:vanadium-dependent haloperoxidase [Tenacibaculum tangerinum]WGH76092.1 vanadium-dependent haloperoxidase [Tenacibaculum tangerinum]
MKLNKACVILAGCAILQSCNTKKEPIEVTPLNYFDAVDLVTEIMIHDVFSPPVASRVYVYPNIAAFEIIAQNNEAYTSLSEQLNGLTPIPKTENPSVNLKVSALVAHLELSKALIFSEDKMIHLRDSLYGVWSDKNEAEFKASEAYGLKVADHIKNWMDSDNYNQTRTMHKFNVDTDDPSRWQPTPPAYMDGIEPHWNKIRTMVLDSASQFKPIPPPQFSLEEGSQFHKELMEVYTVSQDITKKGDDCEEIEIAQFWDCNPFVSVTRGHLMFATKKISPGAHWIGITKIASKNKNFDFNETVYAFTKTSIGIFEAFISCWDEKYRSNLIRPETLINQHLDEKWKPILQTPPFPEYTSGHSVVSGSASAILTSIFGDNFRFIDDTEVQFGLPKRTFTSFNAAAEEAAISRLYGGIHYKAAIEEGFKQGKNVGELVVEKIKMKP